jgi:hypothetical protein
MSTVQVSDGSTAVGTTAVNNGGTVVNGGNIASDNPMTVSKTLATMADGGTDYGSKVLAQDGTVSENEDYAGVQAAKAGGTGGLAFAPDAQAGERNFLIRGAGTADGNNKVNNDASTVLAIPASNSDGVAPQTLIVSTRQLGEDNASFNILARPSTAMVPGRTKGTDAGAASTFVNPEDGTPAVATEILPSRAVPGELTFMFGGANPTNTNDGNAQDYKARDSYES